MEKEKVVILGASDRSDRFSNKAMNLLIHYGHTPVLVHPNLKQIDNFEVYSSCSQINEDIDTITMYIRAEFQDKIRDQIIALSPKRVIFNPGTENKSFEEELEKNNIKALRECTLVLLNTDSY